MKRSLLTLFFVILSLGLFAQAQPPRNPNTLKQNNGLQYSECDLLITPKLQRKRGERINNIYPEKLEAFICFEKGKSDYTESGLNILDSIYKIAFNKENGRFYKLTIIGYDDAEPLNESNAKLARNRAVAIFDYFASREGTEYIVRTTPSTYNTMCEGEVKYFVKYKMPIDFKWINLNNKPANERFVNSINLSGKVYILIEDDKEECLGKFLDYNYPSQDTTIAGKIAMIKIPKGALESITHTKDTIEYSCDITYTEVLSFEDVTKNYQLVPHRNQNIISAGYIVVKAKNQPDYLNCSNRDNVEPNITIKLPIELHQNNARLRFFAKVYKPNGTFDYKPLQTLKEIDKETKLQTLTAVLTPFQLDTIYIGKRVDDKEMADYFYPAKETEPGAFRAMGGWLKPYKLDKKGTIVMKKEMEMVLRKPQDESLGE